MEDIDSKLNQLQDFLNQDLITQEDFDKKYSSLYDRFTTETTPAMKSYAEYQQMRDELINNIIPMFNKSAADVGNIDPIGTDTLEGMEEYVNSITGPELEQVYNKMVKTLNTQWGELSRPWVNPKGIETIIAEGKGLTEAQLMPNLWTALRKAPGDMIKPPMFETYDTNQPWKPHLNLTPRYLTELTGNYSNIHETPLFNDDRVDVGYSNMDQIHHPTNESNIGNWTPKPQGPPGQPINGPHIGYESSGITSLQPNPHGGW